VSEGDVNEKRLHVEDSYHPCRKRYLVLLCLRNPRDEGTTIAPVPSAEELSTCLSQEQISTLMQPRFINQGPNS